VTPWWVAVLVAVIALLGVIINNIIVARNSKAGEARSRGELGALEERTSRQAEDAERRDKREQAIGIFKWAAELAVSEDPRKAQTGVDALAGLVDSALTSAIAQPLRAIEAAVEAGEEIRVVRVELETIEGVDVPLGSDIGPREGGDDGSDA
jgi:hypothetical protein